MSPTAFVGTDKLDLHVQLTSLRRRRDAMIQVTCHTALRSTCCCTVDCRVKTNTSHSHSHRRAPVPLHNLALSVLGGRLNYEIYLRPWSEASYTYRRDVWSCSRPAVTGDTGSSFRLSSTRLWSLRDCGPSDLGETLCIRAELSCASQPLD